MYTSGDDYKNVDDKSEASRNADHFREIRKMVKENLVKAYEQSKKRYDLRARPIEYKLGDVVWRKHFTKSDAIKGKIAKFNSLYVKCTVIRKIGSSSYELKDEDGSVGIYSTDKMRPDS